MWPKLSFYLTPFLFIHSAVLLAEDFSDQDGDGFIDPIEMRYASNYWAFSDPDETPAHGVPIIVGQTEAIDAVQRFPELDNAVNIDAGGFGEQQYVLILKGDGKVASWSLYGAASIEENLYGSNQWIGTHPRQWEGIVDIEVAPFGLFGIGTDGTVSACGEAWAVNAVENFGGLREIETSYDSLIVVTLSGAIKTETNGDWENPEVPDLLASDSEEFEGLLGGVAAGKETFWVLGSERGVKAWGNATELAKMDYSLFASYPLAAIYISPTHAAGISIYRSGSAVPFGDDASGTVLSPSYGSFTTTPGAANAFSSLSEVGYETTASLDLDSPNAPDHWQFQRLTSSDSALFGILQDGTPLEWAVVDELGLNSPAELNDDFWQDLNWLDLTNLPIATLDSIERAINLQTLYFEGTTVRDLSPLEQLDYLTELNASDTPVLDLSPLAWHYFDSSSFIGTAAVEVNNELRTAFGYEMRRIYAEFLARNGSESWQSTAEAPAWWHQFDAGLAELIRVNGYFVWGGLESLSSIIHLNSDILEAEGLELTSLQGVALLSGLQELTVPDQKITDISSIANLPQLVTIDLSNNPLVDFSSLLRLRALQSVDISNTGAAEILDAASEEMPVRQQLVAILDELERRGVSVTNSSANARDDWELHFDAQTAAAIRDDLRISDTALTFEDLENVHEFIPDEYDFEITDLSGLQYAWQIQEIRLQEQAVTDLSPLKDLPYLSRLYMQHYSNEDRGARLADLSPLEGHPSLEHLELNGSNVLDISHLVNLPLLEHLELHDTFFADLLTYGDLENPAFQDADATVNALEASGVSVYASGGNRDDWWRVFEPALGRALLDEAPYWTLDDLENEQILSLNGRGIRDLSGMQHMYQLEDIDLADNVISDLSPLSALLGLRSVDLRNNPVVVLDPLLNLQSLQELNYDSTGAAELGNYFSFDYGSVCERVRQTIAALEQKLISVQGIAYDPRDDWWRQMDSTLSACVLEEEGRADYALGLSDLTQIQTLSASSERLLPIEDLSGVEYMMGLEELNLPNQLITDLSPVNWLTRLRTLDVSNPELKWPMNRVSALESLEGHGELSTVILSNTDVLELEALLTMPVLSSVEIGGTFADELLADGAQDNPYAQSVRQVDSSFQGTLVSGSIDRSDWWRVFDPALGAALADGEASSGQLTLPFLEEIRSVYAAEQGIESLDHIGLLFGLDTLEISSNPITDLSPLAELPNLRALSLDWVGLFAGTVLDIEPLATMRSLQVLDLSDNPLLDIEPLLALPLLQSVDLRLTFVADQPDNPSYWSFKVLENRGVAASADSQSRSDWNRLFDLNLAAAINQALSYPTGFWFSLNDLQQLTQLDASGAGVESLDGLEFAENLESLNLGNNYITDLSPLASLSQLRVLNLETDIQQHPDRNLFKDLSPLANLWSLQDLNLRGTAATDFSVLSELPSLNQVDLQDTTFDPNSELGNRLSALGISASDGGAVDVSRILAPSLYSAILRNNGQIDLNQTHLILDDWGITSLEGIGLFAQLSELSLRNNQISDLSPLRGMSELGDLDVDNTFYDPGDPGIYGNQVSDLSVLATLPKLEVFKAEANLISDISPLLDCARLIAAQLENNFLIETVSGYESPDDLILMRLAAKGVSVDAYTLREDWHRIFSDPVLAAYFVNAREYDLIDAYNVYIDQPVYDLTGLEKCYNLQTLELGESRVQDLSPLLNLRQLQELKLNRDSLGTDHLLSDLSSLSALSNLGSLEVRNQGVSELSVLAQLPALYQVDLTGNYLDLRLGSASSEIIDSLSGQVSFTLGDQRDIWSHITDPGLERAIREHFNLLPDEAITQLHWENLSGLIAPGFGIEDISELTLANNLVGLNLMGNRITDTSALSVLEDLRIVNLSNSEAFPEMGNMVDDLSVFQNSDGLEVLYLDGNLVSDLSPLLGMRNLERIDLDGNPLDLREGSDTVRLLAVLQERGTSVTYDDRYRTGKSDGITLVESNPSAYDLFTENQLRGLALGKPTLELNDQGKFELKLDVYESVNLIEWFPGSGSFEEVDGQFIWKPTNPGDTLFYTIEAQ